MCVCVYNKCVCIPNVYCVDQKKGYKRTLFNMTWQYVLCSYVYELRNCVHRNCLQLFV